MACEETRSIRTGVSLQTIRKRTEAYLENQAQVNPNSNTPPPDTPSPSHIKDAAPLTRHKVPELSPTDPCAVSPTMPRQTQQSEFLPASERQIHLALTPTPPIRPISLLAHASYSDHLPRINTQNSPITPSVNMIDFAKYLARRDLVTTVLTKFDDQPESFRAWQSSFLNAPQGFELTASEELDLLVRWLGKESSEHVKRI